MYHHFNYKFFSELARHVLQENVMIITTFDLRGRSEKKRLIIDEVQTDTTTYTTRIVLCCCR